MQINALPDGPYRGEGNSRIFDHDGRPVPDRGSPVHLRRWGHSAGKPFYDGSHARTGWKDDE